jgi:hypothetical protein
LILNLPKTFPFSNVDIESANDSLDTSQLPRKRTRTEHSDDEDSGSNDQASGGPGHSPEAFLIKAGHRFCIICGPWLHTGALIFQNDLDDTYNTAERFENEESKSQAQLREVWDPLQAKLKLKRVWAVKDGVFSSFFSCSKCS